MSARATRPLVTLALCLCPHLAAAADVFAAAEPIDGGAVMKGLLLSGMELSLVSTGIDPDEIDYDGSLEGIDPDEIDAN